MRRSFLTGLIILLPLAVTIAIVIFIVNLLTDPFTGMVGSALEYTPLGSSQGFLFLTHDQLVHIVSQVLVLILLFLVTIGLGFLTHLFFFHALLKTGDYLLAHIPVVNKVYKTSQEIIKTLIGSSKNAFKQVVMVPFPSSKVYSIGLISGPGPAHCAEALGESLISVFVPTTPNPTSGYLLMFKSEEVIFLDLKVEDALKYVISCGVVTGNGGSP
jgi:uncharacterized membrane protein